MLYINGDVIDRGSGGIKILQHMMLHPNIYHILGNHEYAAGICLLELLKKIQDRTKSILIITTSQSTVVPDMMDVWDVFV